MSAPTMQRALFAADGQESLFTVEDRDRLDAIAAQASPEDIAAARELARWIDDGGRA